eukprot:5767682-Prorocentrum_lima.AAC.1
MGACYLRPTVVVRIILECEDMLNVYIRWQQDSMEQSDITRICSTSRSCTGNGNALSLIHI